MQYNRSTFHGRFFTIPRICWVPPGRWCIPVVSETLLKLYCQMGTCANKWTIYERLHQHELTHSKSVCPVECWCAITFCPMTNWCCCPGTRNYVKLPNLFPVVSCSPHIFLAIYNPSMKNATLMMNSTCSNVRKLCALCETFQPMIKKAGSEKCKKKDINMLHADVLIHFLFMEINGLWVHKATRNYSAITLLEPGVFEKIH